ncbi:MAG: glycosyltransferase family 4 protein [Acidobacteria bacterium]|nr:glycosyltransferase family 4 protein [Acidobacteriota bacterium]
MRGGQRQVMLLMQALREAGHECWLGARENTPLGNAASAAGFLVYGATACEVWRRSKHVTLVHAHDARAHTIAAIASRCQFVVSRRVAFAVRQSLASHWKYRRPARFLAVSHFVAAQLHSAGISREKIDVVYDGVESHACFGEWNSEYPAVALASADPRKGRDLVEEAAGLAGIRTVFSNDLLNDLRRASMFVYITRSEGLGSAALVAMSLGIPVVASRVGGLPEVLGDPSGILVTNDPPEIASAMRRIVQEPDLAHSLIEHGKRRIAECFTKEHLLRRTLASYGRVLDT